MLASSNQAEIGDPILQPGPHDGSRYPDDHIADLAEFVPVNLTGIPSECPIANSTAGFLSGLFKSIPALSEFMNQSGLNLPEYLAKNEEKTVAENGKHPEPDKPAAK